MGGPQAGLAVGRKECIERMRKHPLYRALRVDKVTLAALEATLALYANGSHAPVVEMIQMPLEEIQRKAGLLVEQLDALKIPSKRQEASGYVGGGAIPETQIPTENVIVAHERIEKFVRALRANEPAVVGRIHEDAFCIDMRTVSEDEIVLLANCVAQCWLTA